MKWIDEQVKSGFQDLQGLSITARIPVKDRLINEAIAEFLSGSTSEPSTASAGNPDVRKLLPLVKKAEVHAVDGSIVLDVVITV